MFRLFFLSTAAAVIIDPSKIKEFKWRGPPVIDETIFTNPNSFDYDFNDDLRKAADVEDIYDQNLGQLPVFNLYKLGKNKGVTKLPIVTRKMPTWSTVANTRGPLDFFATPSTPVSPVFVSTEEPKTTPHRLFTTTTPTTTTTTTQKMRTTEAPKTTTTVRPIMSTTTAKTTTTTTAWRRFFQKEKIVPQPLPAFKTGRGPIWRKGGKIEFETVPPTTTPVSSSTSQTRNTFLVFTRRPLNTFGGPFRSFGFQHKNFFRNRHPLETTTSEPPSSTTAIAPIVLRTHQRERTLVFPAPKPVIIHHGATKYRGPTYNCRVLNPFEDGQASPEHNDACKMIYPGLSADGSCRCFYKVSGRDEHGCATGFLFACRPVFQHSVVV